MGKQSKMTTCKHCGAEIAASAKACPKCGGKNQKPIYKRPWFIILIVLIVIGAIGSLGGNKDSAASGVANNSGNTAANSSVTSGTSSGEKSTAPEITYTAYDVSELMDDLDANALKASDKYKDQYVELTGRLNVIDSNGNYISITPSNDQYAIIGVQCYIKSDDQKSAVMDMSIGDTVVVKGKITDVGEIMGYSLNIDEISK